ncbi:speckle-type POZ protein B-like isoform X2 [Phymastichus coffea]|uniref:speckle-type POZ protein B-like isoform X2 n=1 Tax=Phymastichus coffea TaxID=108790 RepID=UPI00273AD87C|nr:speckle-type POZ protein B-like isoform X2 [Phymastichus coffea]
MKNRRMAKYPKPANMPYTDSWCQTHVNVVDANFTWTINNFSFCNEKPGEALESTIFSSSMNSALKWRLQFYPSGNNQENKDYVSLFLHLVTCDKPTIKVDFKFCVIDKDGREVNERKTSEKWQFFQGRQSGFPKFIKKDHVLDPSNGILPQDKLRIVCTIRSATGKVDRISLDSMFPQSPNLLNQLSEDWTQALEEQSFSDVTLESCDGIKLAAHKVVLAARSPVFAAMFEHDMRERHDSNVLIHDIEPDILKSMLRFIYTSRVEDLHCQAARLLAAADKYALDGLKAICEQSLCKGLNIEDAAECLVVAELYRACKLKDKTLNFIRVHLREVLETPNFKALAKDQPALMEEILRSMTKS